MRKRRKEEEVTLADLNHDTQSRIEQYLIDVQRDLHLPGLAVGVVQEGHVVFLRGLGKAGDGHAVSTETAFVIGSLSKSFTATALLQLSEAGKIDLDAPVQHYLPWFCIGNDAIASAQITTRHLLTHTSGLSRFVGRELLGQTKNVGMEQRVRDLKKTRLVHPVGTVFEYSNANYLIAGLLIQVVSGIFYEHYLRQHLLTPLGMRYHTFLSEQSALHEDMATGYRWWFGLPLPVHAPFLSDALPAAFLVSGVEDMVRWLLFHLSEGTVDDVSLLSSEGMRELHKPYVAAGANSSYALGGWRVEYLEDEQVWRHGGETANFLAEMVIVPGQHLGIIALMNCNNGAVAQLGGSRVASGLAKLLLNKPQTPMKLSFRTFYILVDVLIVAMSGLQVWSLSKVLRLQSSRSRISHWREGLALIGDLLVPFLILWRLPRLKLVDSPWSLLRWYVPDLTAWIRVMSVLSLVKAFLRGVRWMGRWRTLFDRVVKKLAIH